MTSGKLISRKNLLLASYYELGWCKMNFIIVLVSLLLIGFLAHYAGKVAELIRLPSLIGMIVIGMLIGPAFFDLVPEITLGIAPKIKDIALVTVLFIGGLGISYKQMKTIG